MLFGDAGFFVFGKNAALEPRPGLIVIGGDEPETNFEAHLRVLGACYLRKPFAPDEFTREVSERCNH